MTVQRGFPTHGEQKKLAFAGYAWTEMKSESQEPSKISETQKKGGGGIFFKYTKYDLRIAFNP